MRKHLLHLKKLNRRNKYKGLVPYYIAQIFYFEGKKDEALRYGEEALSRNDVYYRNDLNLLIGQIYFEKKQFAKALAFVTGICKQQRQSF